jgi:hypothetical protein
MGAAAYRRASEVIAKRILMEKPTQHTAFAIMDRLNALPKVASAKKPFLNAMCATFDRGVWWLMDPENIYEGYSLFYASLNDLVRSWDFYLTGYNEITGIWTLTVLE